MLLCGGIVLVALILLIFHSRIIEQLLPFVQDALSSDHHITAEGMAFFSKMFLAMSVGLFLLGMVTLAVSIPCLRLRLRKRSAFQVFLAQSRQRRASLGALGASMSSAMLLILLRTLSSSAILPAAVGLEDGFLESLSALLFLLSSLLLGVAALRPSPALPEISRSAIKKLRIGYFLMALILLFVGMEEISWGQRLIGWGTSDLVAELNTQDETNLHNTQAIGAIIYYVGHRFAGIAIAIGSLMAWMLLWKKRFIRLVVPHPELIGVIVLLALFSVVWVNSEFVEELFSVVSITYAIRVIAMGFRLHLSELS